MRPNPVMMRVEVAEATRRFPETLDPALRGEPVIRRRRKVAAAEIRRLPRELRTESPVGIDRGISPPASNRCPSRFRAPSREEANRTRLPVDP